MRITIDNIKKYISVIIVFLPILAQYGFFSKSFTCADLALIPLIILLFVFGFYKRKLIINDKLFLLFVVWYILISFVLSILSKDLFNTSSITTIIQCTIYSIFILQVSKDLINITEIVNIYTKVVIILSIIIFVQLFIYKITGEIRPWVIKSQFFPLTFTNDDYFSGGYMLMLGGDSFRPASIFTEPALFAQYTTPCLILNLFINKKSKKNVLLIMLVTIATLFTKSANGMIYIIIVWLFAILIKIYDYVKSKRKKINKKYIYLFILGIIIVPIIFYKFIDSNQEILKRFLEITDITGYSSGSMRVMRGWNIYSKMNNINKLFGIGSGNIISYLNLHPHLVPMFESSYNGYMSGLSSIYVNSGLVGGLIYLIWLINIYFSTKKYIVKCLVIFLFLYLIASNSLFTANFIVITILIINLKNIENFDIM